MTFNYYQKHKANLQKDAWERYHSLFEDEKIAQKGPNQISKSFLKRRKQKSVSIIVKVT